MVQWEMPVRDKLFGAGFKWGKGYSSTKESAFRAVMRLMSLREGGSCKIQVVTKRPIGSYGYDTDAMGFLRVVRVLGL